MRLLMVLVKPVSPNLGVMMLRNFKLLLKLKKENR
jgi:hypothetical protein